MDRIKKIFLEKAHHIIPSWIILVKDLFLVLFSFASAYTLRYNFQVSDQQLQYMYMQMIPVGLTAIIVFLLFGLHKGIVRHTSLRDAIQIVKAMTIITGMMFLMFILDNLNIVQDTWRVPRSIIIIFYTLSTVMLVATRAAIRLFYYWIKSDGDQSRVLIYGAGSAGIITKNVLHADHSMIIKVVGFIDDNPRKIGKTIEGIYVYSSGVLNPKFLQKNEIDEIIFAINNIEKDRKREIVEELLLKTKVHVKEIPPVHTWVEGKLSVKQISTVKVTDLLQRSEIKLDNKNVLDYIKGKRVMVTGAAGSIGSELVRQLCNFSPDHLVLIDQGETPMFHLENEIKEKIGVKHVENEESFYPGIEFIVANIGDSELMNRIFDEFRPQIIFHAAAYKHVPMMERNPFEAVRVNILGTKNLADLAAQYHAEKFVMISTDKAVNPTNVMGATKRAAEIYIQSLNDQLKAKQDINVHPATQYITTRFGNVLGSNGSVIPLFEKQIAKGGPVTVTHPDITRYFMTIPEACQLVLEAGALGVGGQILMFDMGKPVRIADLAFSMIRLSGFEPGKDINITFTGLRPGEKLYEELLYEKEKGLATPHPKIFVGKVKPYSFTEVIEHIDSLDRVINAHHQSLSEIQSENLNIIQSKKGKLVSFDTNIELNGLMTKNMELIGKLKIFIPEYISNNSVFETLDKSTELTQIPA